MRTPPPLTDQMHAFGEAGLPYDFQFPGSGPFSQCAATDHLVEFDGDLYFDEGTFQNQNPYVWSTTQDCTRVSSTVAEVEGTLLVGKKAIYAGDPSLAAKDPQVRHLRAQRAAVHQLHEELDQPARAQVPHADVADRHALLLQPRRRHVPPVGPAGGRAVQGGRGDDRRARPATPTRPGSSPRPRRRRTTTPSASSSGPP